MAILFDQLNKFGILEREWSGINIRRCPAHCVLGSERWKDAHRMIFFYETFLPIN